MKSAISLLMLLTIVSTANALTPPKYLSVPQWKSCVSTIKKGSADFVCTPSTKPLDCPAASWKLLKCKRLVPACHE